MAKVQIYSTPTCAFCKMAKEYFKSKRSVTIKTMVLSRASEALENLSDEHPDFIEIYEKRVTSLLDIGERLYDEVITIFEIAQIGENKIPLQKVFPKGDTTFEILAEKCMEFLNKHELDEELVKN